MQDNAGGNLTTEPVLSTFSMKQFQEMITIEFLNNCINSARIGLTGPWRVRVSPCLSERMHVSSSIDTTWHPSPPDSRGANCRSRTMFIASINPPYILYDTQYSSLVLSAALIYLSIPTRNWCWAPDVANVASELHKLNDIVNSNGLWHLSAILSAIWLVGIFKSKNIDF